MSAENGPPQEPSSRPSSAEMSTQTALIAEPQLTTTRPEAVAQKSMTSNHELTVKAQLTHPHSIITASHIWLGRGPTVLRCPCCGACVRTTVRYRRGSCFWLYFMLFYMIMWCYAFILLCIDFMEETYHYCSHCGVFLGVRLSDF